MKKLFAAALAIAVFLASASLAFAEGSLLPNGDFEVLDGTGDLPEGWQYEAWYTDADSGYADMAYFGTNAAVYIYCSEGGNDARIYQSVQVEDGEYYRLACKVKADGVSGGAGANISVNGSLASSEGVFGESEWTDIELIGKTGKKQTELTVCVRVGGYGALSSGGAWFDDVTVEKLDSYSGEAADLSIADVPSDGGESDYETGEIPRIVAMITAVLASSLLSMWFYCRFIKRRREPGGRDLRRDGMDLAAVLAAGFALRVALSVIFVGHSTDISCFKAWASILAAEPMRNFYTSGLFADYPPGYMYVLCLLGKLGRLLSLEYDSAGYTLLIKMPGIIADLIAAYLVYAFAKKRMTADRVSAGRAPRLPLAMAAAVAFNPVMAFISGGWGQIDQVLTLVILASLLLFIDKKTVLAGLVYGVAIMIKPQALIVGPLYAAAYFMYAYDGGVKAVLRTAGAVLAALGAIFVMSLPFRGAQEPLWFIDKLLGTATSYPYASIEAFNLASLLGGNWTSVDASLLGLTYGAWGTVLIISGVAFSIVLYAFGRKREPHCLTLSMGYLVAAVFTLGHYMHERYLFPALLLLALAFIVYGDRRLFAAYLWLSVSMLFNVLLAYVIVDHPDARGMVYSIFTFMGSLSNVAAFVYLTCTVSGIVFKRKKFPPFTEKPADAGHDTALPEPADTRLHYTRRDYIYVLAVTLIYGVIALVNLGTTTAPETPWYGYEGDTVEFTLEREFAVSDIRVFGGLYEGRVSLTDDGGVEYEYTETNGDMFRWVTLAGGAKSASFTMEVTEGSVWFNEIAFFDENGEYIPVAVSAGAEALTDEPMEVPADPSYMNGMYFDELYHARTAYEHLHGLAPYENSHPPLGKIFIMLGIAVFGMNAWGWRIVGALFGIGMVPIIYAFGKRLFKRSEYALAAAVLFAFDFMHYTQTRIATIDVYGVFFIILMYYYMYRYFTLNFYSDGLKKTLKPLFLAGLFFGLGAASKWICIYAGGGLAVILFTSLGRRYIEYRKYLASEDERERAAAKLFWPNTVKTLLLCCVFYIALPVAIYLLSYLPYVLSVEAYDLEGIWGVQKFMFSYHSGLTATHAYQSPWWQWPFILRPIWYQVDYTAPEGMIGTISAMGNPAVWWLCGGLTAAVAVKRLRGTLPGSKELFVLMVGLGANFLPWLLVTRCTFIYHYFASVPFIVLIGVWFLMQLEERYPALKNAKWVWMGLAVLLFVLFYPVTTGVYCPKWYITALEWLPSWTFMGY